MNPNLNFESCYGCKYFKAVFLTASIYCMTNFAYAATIGEYWATYNKDGNWRNSNTNSVQGTLRIKWVQNLKNFDPYDANVATPYMGQRSNNFSIRNGRIALIIP